MSILWRLAVVLVGTVPTAATAADPTADDLDDTTDDHADSVDGHQPTGTARGPPDHPSSPAPSHPYKPAWPGTPTRTADRLQGEVMSATKDNY